MFVNIAKASALFAGLALAIPASRAETSGRDLQPEPPMAAVRPLWVAGTENTKTQSITILPTTIAESARSSDDDISIYATMVDSYTFWQGNGISWPQKSAWGDFDQLWSTNLPLIRQSCGWNGWGADNSEDEISYMKTAIQQVANEAALHPRFILVIIMQETGGCVRAPTTDNGVRNPGLMQSHNGSGTCSGVNPCPNSQILQMIRDGTTGTSSGDGIKQCLATTDKVLLPDNPHTSVFAAARLYNSGSVDYNNLNNGFSSIKCYSCDVANRLTGWTYATRTCS